jgi:hypothetical protein
MAFFLAQNTYAREMENLPVVKLRTLDKITARTVTFEARVGGTIKFGPLYIKTQSCQKAPPVEQPESAAFLQIWEIKPDKENKQSEGTPEWIFSGWMFSSSPALSYMDHPVYDVWVLDCLPRKSSEKPPADSAVMPGEGEMPANTSPPSEPTENTQSTSENPVEDPLD